MTKKYSRSRMTKKKCVFGVPGIYRGMWWHEVFFKKMSPVCTPRLKPSAKHSSTIRKDYRLDWLEPGISHYATQTELAADSAPMQSHAKYSRMLNDGKLDDLKTVMIAQYPIIIMSCVSKEQAAGHLYMYIGINVLMKVHGYAGIMLSMFSGDASTGKYTWIIHEVTLFG